jgi:hypothetical protein
MADGAIQFFGDIDFRTGSNGSITTPKSFATRSDVGGAKNILVTNGDNALKRIVCVDASTTIVNLATKIKGFSADRNKVFTHIGMGGLPSSADEPQVKWEMWLPRFQSIAIQKDSTDKIYIQKAVLHASNGTITHSNGTNIVVTPLTRMYKDTYTITPLPGHSTTAAGKVNRTNLNKATCFIATTSSADDGSNGRCIVVADAAGNTIAKTMIPGYSYMKIFKKPTDTVYCEESIFSDSSGNEDHLVNMRFSPIGITE